MKISFDETKYTTFDNGELSELKDNSELMQEMLSNFGKYKLKSASIVQDPEYAHRRNLVILAKDEKGKPSAFVFDMYGIRYIKLGDRKVASNVISSKKQYLDLAADFTTKMIQVNNDTYKNTALATYTNVINYCNQRISILQSITPKTEKERLQIQEEIEERQKALKQNQYILSKIQENLSSCSSERQ